MGLDKSIPYYSVNMVCAAPQRAPRGAALPAGYAFAGYADGMEEDWARILVETGMADSRERALEGFREFRENLPLTRERMLFVRDGAGDVVATATLWQSEWEGESLARIHWVGVLPAHEGKGIAKAMLSRLFRRYDELGLTGRVFLVTQSWSYPAIHIYQTYGFAPAPSDPPEAWELIQKMLGKER